MSSLKLISNPKIDTKFNNYPPFVKDKMFFLRKLVIETAKEIKEIEYLEETFKWGEPSYITKIGSTLRMDWKQKNPDYYALYFSCSTRLVETFRLVFKNDFEFEKNRAILLKIEDTLEQEKIKTCIKSALCYHKVKHLPTLGI